MLDPNSPQVQSIWNLFLWSLGIGTAIFVLVAGLIAAAIVRSRRQNTPGEPRQIAGNTRLEITWTALPALLLVGLFIPTLLIMRDTSAPPPSDPQAEPDIILRGYQWWWRVEYPASGIVSANEIHVPVGQRLLVRLEADDVIHNFWVPDLVPKQYMIPGNPNNVWLEANEPGVYRGVCGEYCGVQHARMQIAVVVHPQDEYDAWLAAQQQTEPTEAAPNAQLVAEGQQLYNELTCVNCHAIGGGEGAPGAGPNLANFGSRLTIGAGTVPNTPEHLTTWIAEPNRIKQGVYMPGYERILTEDQIAALVAYLRSLQ
jgi:cytochrome c oxidase subunit II